jgi:hypothetical protein
MLKFVCPKCRRPELVESEEGYCCWACGYYEKHEETEDDD